MGKLVLPPHPHRAHVAMPLRIHTKLDWWTPGRSIRYRVRDYTCECMSVVYELCASGGLMFIRRIYRNNNAQHVKESDRWVTSHAEEMWQQLLTGQAR